MSKIVILLATMVMSGCASRPLEFHRICSVQSTLISLTAPSAGVSCKVEETATTVEIDIHSDDNLRMFDLKYDPTSPELDYASFLIVHNYATDHMECGLWDGMVTHVNNSLVVTAKCPHPNESQRGELAIDAVVFFH
jgi:hypothetical protein